MACDGKPAQCFTRRKRSSSAAATSLPSRISAAAESAWNALRPRIIILDLRAYQSMRKMVQHANETSTIKRARWCILAFLLMSACNESGTQPAATAQSTIIPMNAQAWTIRYSPGMPPHPTPQPGGGWYFDFPSAPDSVHYVLAGVNMGASSSVNASILITTTGAPVFVYNLQPDNNCAYP